MRRPVRERREGCELNPAPDLLTGLPTEGARIMAEMIIEAFAGVTREGGVSWSEAEVIDKNGTAEECALARAGDRDREWTELLGDPAWTATVGSGGFPFLNAIGFRYYLPAAMIRWLQGENEGYLPYNLTLSDGAIRDSQLGQWSFFDDAQRMAVARFVRYCRDFEETDGNPVDDWHRAYEAYWRDFDPGAQR